MRKFKPLVKSLGYEGSDQSAIRELRRKAVHKLPAEDLESVRRLKEWRRKQWSKGGYRFAFAPWPWKIDWKKGMVLDCDRKRKIAFVAAAKGDKFVQIKFGSKEIFNERARDLYAEAATGWVIRAAPEMAEALFMAVCIAPGKPLPTRLRKRFVTLLVNIGVIADQEKRLFENGLVVNEVVEILENWGKHQPSESGAQPPVSDPQNQEKYRDGRKYDPVEVPVEPEPDGEDGVVDDDQCPSPPEPAQGPEEAQPVEPGAGDGAGGSGDRGGPGGGGG